MRIKDLLLQSQVPRNCFDLARELVFFGSTNHCNLESDLQKELNFLAEEKIVLLSLGIQNLILQFQVPSLHEIVLIFTRELALFGRTNHCKHCSDMSLQSLQ